MKLSKFKEHLEEQKSLIFELPNGKLIPTHFHVTEIGEINKHFIDCGGVIRKEKKVNFQLWEADDYNHRLHPEKLLSIISLSEEKLNLEDAEIEVEYQGETIGKFGISLKGNNFLLTNNYTDCLAKDNCKVPEEKDEKTISETEDANSGVCIPGGGCC